MQAKMENVNLTAYAWACIALDPVDLKQAVRCFNRAVRQGIVFG